MACRRADIPDPKDLARRVLTSLDALDARRQADPARRRQAAMGVGAGHAAGSVRRARRRLAGVAHRGRYVEAPGADGFEIGSTERQLREVWRLDLRPGGSGSAGAGAAQGGAALPHGRQRHVERRRRRQHHGGPRGNAGSRRLEEPAVVSQGARLLQRHRSHRGPGRPRVRDWLDGARLRSADGVGTGPGARHQQARRQPASRWRAVSGIASAHGAPARGSRRLLPDGAAAREDLRGPVVVGRPRHRHDGRPARQHPLRCDDAVAQPARDVGDGAAAAGLHHRPSRRGAISSSRCTTTSSSPSTLGACTTGRPPTAAAPAVRSSKTTAGASSRCITPAAAASRVSPATAPTTRTKASRLPPFERPRDSHGKGLPCPASR